MWKALLRTDIMRIIANCQPELGSWLISLPYRWAASFNSGRWRGCVKSVLCYGSIPSSFGFRAGSYDALFAIFNLSSISFEVFVIESPPSVVQRNS